MNALTHAVKDDELEMLWPVIEHSGLWRGREEFDRLRADAPWRVRLSRGGGLLVLDLWRERLNALSIKAAWHAEEQLTELVAEALRVMRGAGYSLLVSPLVVCEDADAYRAAGMRERERVVVYQAHVDDIVALRAVGGVTIRPATPQDIVALCALDERCFPELWQYGEAELRDALLWERLMVAVDDDGTLLGYSEAEQHRDTVVLGRLATDPAARRRGIATALISDCADWAGTSGAEAVTLCTQADNDASHALYERSGLRMLKRERLLFVGR